MSEAKWTDVDRYIGEALGLGDEVLAAALEASAAARLPNIAVSPAQGMLLHILARSVGAERILEIGTLGGYSTIWLGRALPAHGRVVTLELDPRHADVAEGNFERAGLAGRIEVRRGAALDSLAELAKENAGPFDFSFIDADKANIPAYFEAALELSRPGALIVVDNVIRDGAVVDARSKDESVRGVRRLNEFLGRDKRVTATTIQTVGVKGYDGLTIALVNG
jgi:predicted O-methyltransferase YrrM